MGEVSGVGRRIGLKKARDLGADRRESGDCSACDLGGATTHLQRGRSLPGTWPN